MSFLQLEAEKKTQFLVQFKQIFGPSYFVRALVRILHKNTQSKEIFKRFFWLCLTKKEKFNTQLNQNEERKRDTPENSTASITQYTGCPTD